MKFSKAIAGFLLIIAVFLLGAITLWQNTSDMLDEADAAIAEGRAMVLGTDTNADSLARFLCNAGYVKDPADAALASQWICRKIASNGAPENLGELNKPRFKIPADSAMEFGGEKFRSRVKTDWVRLGLDADWQQRPTDLPDQWGNPADKGIIDVDITDRRTLTAASRSGIAVRLRRHRLDTIPSLEGGVDKTMAVSETLGYAATDASGHVRFHVEPGGSYSVLPMASGYQFGPEQGTTATGTLSGNLALRFTRSPHVLSPIDAPTYRMLKADRALIVRTPAQWQHSLLWGCFIYLTAWTLLMLLTIARDRLMHTRSDYLLIVVLMALTGIGLLAMYAINNPLTDMPYGLDTAEALGIGIAAMGVMSCINYVKLYNGRSRVQAGRIPFDPLARLLQRSGKDSAKSLRKSAGITLSSGIIYLLFAMILLMALAIWGKGPEGSLARVNLGGFQPSELTKYLFLVFVAAFFAENAALLQDFSTRYSELSIRRQMAILAVVIAAIVVMLGIHVVVLSDMGPALVLLVTFILIYSMARRDFGKLILGLTSFLVVIIGAWLLGAGAGALLLVAAAWFAAWIFWCIKVKRQLYESAILLNFLILAFALGGHILRMIGADNAAARLLNRSSMAWGGVWDNQVAGGDQVAQGIWSLSTGGATGMGLGRGNPSLVPACHTDMIFSSLGEMLGLVGLLLVIFCFVALVHRALLIGRKAAQPFAMFLVMGIAIVTGVQFLFIVLGSLGLIPLSGVSLPLLSYGRTGLIITLAMMGVVLSVSRFEATDSQRQYASTFNNSVAWGAMMFIVGGLVVLATLIKYQVVDRKELLLRPAFITDITGARVVAYNPRIALVLNRMHAGNIYDRNGLLLATSSRDNLLEALPELGRAGLDTRDLQFEAHKRRRRYYPFAESTVFATGDANTRIVYDYYADNPIGYLAENRHFSLLRGFDIPSTPIEMSSESYRENRFMPAASQQFGRSLRDYSTILPYLDYDADHNPLIDEHNSRRNLRDIYLTIDARLQRDLQNEMAKKLPIDARLGLLDNLRASVVVVDAVNGDLLASANYPLPEQDTIAMLREMKIYGDVPHEQLAGHAPITERDLGTTYATMPGSTAKVISAMAALRQNGLAAAEQTFSILPREIIHRGEPVGVVDMNRAIVNSSNNYFINAVNEDRLYPQLESIYSAIGASLSFDVASPLRSATSYYFSQGELNTDEAFHSIITDIAKMSYSTYNIYMKEHNGGNLIKSRKDYKWNWWATNMAWGQGALRATPLAMARLSASVANDGSLVPTRYLLRYGKQPSDAGQPLELLPRAEADRLKQMMVHEASVHSGLAPYNSSSDFSIGGKTGTPERGSRSGETLNDAWYTFFISPSNPSYHPIAVTIRLERTEKIMSGAAIDVARSIVIPTLEKLGYTHHK